MSSIPIALTMQGIPPREQVFCIKCSHLLGNRSHPEDHETWRCNRTKAVTGMNLVTGEETWSAAFCKNVRSEGAGPDSCGLVGIWYDEYIPPQFLEIPEVDKPRKGKLTATDLDNL